MDIDDILAEVSGDAIPQETLDLQSLTRAWVTERSAPEILPYPEALMSRILERVRQQIELVEELTGTTDPKATFRLIILQTELERFKYLTRSFLRARLAKIDAFGLHHLTNPEAREKLSGSELRYVTAHTALLHEHYRACFLGQFPVGLQRMDDAQGGVNMVEGPDVEKAVFVRGLRDVGVQGEGGEEGFDLRRGDVVVCRWGWVKGVVERGDAELI